MMGGTYVLSLGLQQLLSISPPSCVSNIRLRVAVSSHDSNGEGSTFKLTLKPLVANQPPSQLTLRRTPCVLVLD